MLKCSSLNNHTRLQIVYILTELVGWLELRCSVLHQNPTVYQWWAEAQTLAPLRPWALGALPKFGRTGAGANLL